MSILPVSAPSSNRVFIDDSILLDGRLALFHQRQNWLAVADLHFGYELSQRAQGNLFPLWGMQNIEKRLDQLLTDYHPRHLILLGDLVHDSTGADDFFALVSRLQDRCNVVLIAGNHDRGIKHRRSSNGSSARTMPPILDSWRSGDFYFHHGDRPIENADRIQVIGHHHPTGAVRDGVGLNLRLPALVQQKKRWIMPAFSPWAAGADWFDPNGESRIWLCSPERILQLNADSLD